MKYRNKKAIATLIVTTLIFTCGATGVQAAPAADLNIVGNVAAAPISGVSLAVAQANTQTAAEQAALVQNMGVAQIDNYLNVRSEASTDSEVVGIMKITQWLKSQVLWMAGTRSHPDQLVVMLRQSIWQLEIRIY